MQGWKNPGFHLGLRRVERALAEIDSFDVVAFVQACDGPFQSGDSIFQDDHAIRMVQRHRGVLLGRQQERGFVARRRGWGVGLAV
jgi:hypothetical protein